MNLFLRSGLTLDGLAQHLRETLNIPHTNLKEYHIDQQRHSETYGIYYLFEVMGLELRLIVNENQALIESMCDYPYYLNIVSQVQSTPEDMLMFGRHLATILTYSGMEVNIETQE